METQLQNPENTVQEEKLENVNALDAVASTVSDESVPDEYRFLEYRMKNNDFLNAEQNRTLRKELSSKVYKLVCYWLGFVCLVVFLTGVKTLKTVKLIAFIYIPRFSFELSDSVLIALISATAIIGLLGIILSGLFKVEEEKGKKEDQGTTHNHNHHYH